MQVDNPISVLTQDNAKTFLFKCDDGKMFKFFMRATHLEEITREYASALQEKDLAEELLMDKKEQVKVLEKQVNKWEKRVMVRKYILYI